MAQVCGMERPRRHQAAVQVRTRRTGGHGRPGDHRAGGADRDRRSAQPGGCRVDADAAGHHGRHRPGPGGARPQQAVGVLGRHNSDPHRGHDRVRPRPRCPARSVRDRCAPRPGTCGSTWRRSPAAPACGRRAEGCGSTSRRTDRRGTSASGSWCRGPTGASSTRSRTSPAPPRERSGSTGRHTTSRPASRGRCSTTDGAAGPTGCTGTGAPARAAPTAGRSASRSGAGGPTARVGRELAPGRRAPQQDQRGARLDLRPRRLGGALAGHRCRGRPDLLALPRAAVGHRAAAPRVADPPVLGHWSGRVLDDSGAWVRVADVVGWAEDARNRW